MRTSLLCLTLLAAGCGSSAPAPAARDAAADHAVDAPADSASDGATSDRSFDLVADLARPDDGVVASADASVEAGRDSGSDAADGGLDGAGTPPDAADGAALDGPDGPMPFLAIDPCLDAASYGPVMTAPTIAFVANEFAGYTPRCVKVARHSTVTWIAAGTTFGDHPLSPGTTGSPGNPIPPTASGTSRPVTFDEPGFFPFHCQQHPVPMRGVVWVSGD